MNFSPYLGFIRSARQNGFCHNCGKSYAQHQRIWYDPNRGGICIECYQSALAMTHMTAVGWLEVNNAMHRLDEISHIPLPFDKATRLEFNRLLEIVNGRRLLPKVKLFLQNPEFLNFKSAIENHPPDEAGGER